VDVPRFETRKRQENFIFSKMPIQTLPFNVWRGPLLAVKRPAYGDDNLLPSNARLRMSGATPLLSPLYVFMACIGRALPLFNCTSDCFVKRTEPQAALRGFHWGDHKHYRVIGLDAVQSGRNLETS
jgi:hypothetical protein